MGTKASIGTKVSKAAFAAVLAASVFMMAACAAGSGNAGTGGESVGTFSEEKNRAESGQAASPADEGTSVTQDMNAENVETADASLAAQGNEGNKVSGGNEAGAGDADTDEENYDTGDASLDDILNQDGIGEKEMLTVSFGTSFNDSRRLTIGAIEQAMKEAFPEWSVRRGFTSQIIIDHVKRRDGLAIDNFGEALDRAVNNGVKKLVIQPTHLMDGFEYQDILNELADYADQFDAIAVGEPLLATDDDFERVAKAITAATAEYDDGKTAICFMGHGTEAKSNKVYTAMQEKLSELGFEHYYVGTVEAEPSLEDLVEAVKQGGYEKVVLEPLMVVAGDHANNDMAGEEEDSWKHTFEEAGFETECILRGLGELPDIRQIYVEHAKAAAEAAEKADGNVIICHDAVFAAPANASAESADIADGDYNIDVRSSSSMFKITECVLHVHNGSMTADMTLSGKGYSYLFMGTAAEAENAAEAEYIGYTENAEGAYVYTVPVEALNVETDCAAFSKKRESWYDRKLIFCAPAEAGGSEAASAAALADSEGSKASDGQPASEKAGKTSEKVSDSASAAAASLTEGQYEAEVQLHGGSGKASLKTPAVISVKDGKITAEIVFTSPYYDYMIVDGVKYLPESTGKAADDGKDESVFIIPVGSIDKDLKVTADTTAMSEPHEIEYTISFDSAGLKAQK